MEISKKLDYALRMMCEVARAGEGSVVSVREVAEKNNIPYSFARTIQHEMVQNGLLLTTRGSHGGMRLATSPATLTLLDIVEAVEGPVYSLDKQCRDASPEAFPQFASVWEELARLVRGCLASVTLEQLAVEGLVPVAGEDLSFTLVKGSHGTVAKDG